MDPHPPVPDRVTGRLGQRCDVDEPLQRQPRLHHRGAALAVPDGVQVRPPLGDDPALLTQRGDHRGPCLEPVQALERTVRGDHAAVVEHGDAGQVVAAADLEVVRVVGRGDLDRAGAERRVDVLVGHDRCAGSSTSRPTRCVPLVIRMYRDGCVAEHRLGAGGGHDGDVAVAVPDRDQFTVLVAVLDLDVAQRGQASGAPVDTLGPVDQAVIVQPLEDRQDITGQPGPS
jgi:hypothetical protein